MTNDGMQSPHILTIDYLIHISPVILDFDRKIMKYGLGMIDLVPLQLAYTKCTSDFSGGAFAAMVTVGGVPIRCTVDTGASITISVSKSKKENMKCKSLNKTLRQTGINGENICSDIYEADVHFCNSTLPGSIVFVNSNEVEDTDGYIGIGLLKCFNMLIHEDSLFCKRNRQTPSAMKDYENVCHTGMCK